MIELGDKVKDLISGYEGIVTAKVEFLNGCIQYMVAPILKKGQQIPETSPPTIDSQSLIVIGKNFINKKKEKLGEKEKVVRKRLTGGANTFIRMRNY